MQVVDANLEIDLAEELAARGAGDGAAVETVGGGSTAEREGGEPARENTGTALVDAAVALVADGVAATGCERVVVTHTQLVDGLDMPELARRLPPVLARDVSIFTCDEESDGGAKDDGARESAPLALLARGGAAASGGPAFAGDFLLRIVYAKDGEALQFSHRETLREMERCVRRAGLPYDVSCGARPHMRTAPGPALPPGCVGHAEPFDVRLCAYVPADEACAALNRVMPSGLAVVSCAYVGLHAEHAGQAFPTSDWAARVAGVGAQELQAALDALVEQGFLEVKKVQQTKAGPVEKIKRVDFAGRLVAPPRVAAAPVPANACAQAEASGQAQLCCTWTTRDTGNGALRADLFMAELLSRMPDARLLSISRVGLRGEERAAA